MAAVALAVLDATELDAMAEGGDTGLPAWVERDTIAVAAFREYSVAQAHEATVHPRWEELKARADQALKDGDLDGAIEGFTSVLSIAEATHAVASSTCLIPGQQTQPERSSPPPRRTSPPSFESTCLVPSRRAASPTERWPSA